MVQSWNNIFRKEYSIIGLDIIQNAIDSGKIDHKKPINAKVLKENGVITRVKDCLLYTSDAADE